MATATARSSNSKSTNSQKTRPAWSKKVFPLNVAVFEFENENGPPNFSVRLTRTFRRDEESEWEDSDFLGGADLLRGAKLLEAADEFVQSRIAADYQARKSDANSK